MLELTFCFSSISSCTFGSSFVTPSIVILSYRRVASLERSIHRFACLHLSSLNPETFLRSPLFRNSFLISYTSLIAGREDLSVWFGVEVALREMSWAIRNLRGGLTDSFGWVRDRVDELDVSQAREYGSLYYRKKSREDRR